MDEKMKKRLLDCVPDNWLDPLLSGPNRERMQAVSERNEAMRRTYEGWQHAEAHLHPFDRARRGYAALAQVFGVSYHIARNVITYWRTE